jgi:lipopolysaccharide biosynthesis protein
MVKPVAFYLPQYHPIPENDEWWGKGFTEWTNVIKGKPNFAGHHQPHVPGELGYYDLRKPEVMRRQVELARGHGVEAWCFYYYWFNGRRVLERPLNHFASAKDLKLDFCVCWANENWTRTWDGKENDVLLGQKHTPEDDVAFLESLLPLFKDPRYLKVGGAPMLLVYRVDLFPDARATAERWRKIARAAGFPNLHLCAVQFYGITDPRPWGFDAAVEFPPHQLIGPENRPDQVPAFTNPEFRGDSVDYLKVMSQALRRPLVDYVRYRGVMPSWDNTARRQNTPHVFLNSSPLDYQAWLTAVVAQTRLVLPEEQQFVFINAWNEWGEGCHLEPDQKYGNAWLEATKAALDAPDLVSALVERGRAEGLHQREAWKQLVEAFEARERSLLALQDVVRKKSLRIAELEREVPSDALSSKALLRKVAKKELTRIGVPENVVKWLAGKIPLRRAP